jgi:hypothetical protein
MDVQINVGEDDEITLKPERGWDISLIIGDVTIRFDNDAFKRLLMEIFKNDPELIIEKQLTSEEILTRRDVDKWMDGFEDAERKRAQSNAPH